LKIRNLEKEARKKEDYEVTVNAEENMIRMIEKIEIREGIKELNGKLNKVNNMTIYKPRKRQEEKTNTR
jgi:hypothetical protein